MPAEAKGPSSLVLSLFPGIGMLDRAFEEEGFCVVRGPDLIWGGDIHAFSPVPGRFDGVIGGPPCQAFSRLRHMVKANGYETAPNLIPEYERVVGEAAPTWFVMENVPEAPLPVVPGYVVKDLVLRDHWVGGATTRERRFFFGTRDGRALAVETLALVPVDAAPAVTGDLRRRPVAIGGSGRRKMAAGTNAPESLERMLGLQGLPKDFFGDHHAFKDKAMRKMIGNGVPHALGKAVARAVKAAVAAPARSTPTRQKA